MRRILCVILLGGLLLTILSGCTSREPSSESGSESRTASASEPLSPEDPSELEPHALLNWYQRMGLPTASRDGSLETWIAADDLENALRESFTAADPAFLREQAAYYDTDAGQYHALLTGGRGSGLTYWAAPLRQNGDTWTVLLSGANAEGTRVRGSLTVLRQDDDLVRLVSWNPDRSTMS